MVNIYAFFKPKQLKTHLGEYIREYPIPSWKEEVDEWVFTLHALPLKYNTWITLITYS